MRILIISYYYPPIRSVASERLYCFAKYLSELGNDVDVLTTDNGQAFTNDLAGVNITRIRSRVLAYIEHRFAYLKSDCGNMTEAAQKEGFIAGLFRRINAFRIKRGLGYLGRMPDVTDFWCLAARKWLKKQNGWDCIIASHAPYSNLMLGLYAKKQGKCATLVCDFRDLWTRHHLFPGLFPFTIIEKYLEARAIRNADLVTTVSRELAGEIKRCYPSATPEVISNGYRPANDMAPANISLPGKARYSIVHTGSLYPDVQNLEPLFTAMAELAKSGKLPPGTLSLVFAGANQEAITTLATRFNLSNVVHHAGLVSIEASRSLQSQADMLLYLDFQHLPYDGLIPVKLYEYAATGKPVIFLQERTTSSADDFLKQCGTGIFVNNTHQAIRELLAEIANDSVELPNHPDWTYIEQFSRVSSAGRLNSLISNLNAPPSGQAQTN